MTGREGESGRYWRSGLIRKNDWGRMMALGSSPQCNIEPRSNTQIPF